MLFMLINSEYANLYPAIKDINIINAGKDADFFERIQIEKNYVLPSPFKQPNVTNGLTCNYPLEKHSDADICSNTYYSK
jgi:hypothetical protein